LGEGVDVFLCGFVGGFEIARDRLEGLAEFGIHADWRVKDGGTGLAGFESADQDRSASSVRFWPCDNVKATSIIVGDQKAAHEAERSVGSFEAEPMYRSQLEIQRLDRHVTLRQLAWQTLSSLTS
jgi:hypothetical protein